MRGGMDRMYMIINGCKIYYEVYGEENKDTIFFIHGAPGLGDCRSDLNAFKTLATDFQLVFLDMRGSGRSEQVPPYTHEQWTADIDTLRKHIGVEKIMIHGGSYGGFLSLEYVLRYPDHVAGVLLRDTAANQKYNNLSTEKALHSNLPGITEEMLNRLWDGHVRSNEDMKTIYRAIQPLYTFEYDEEKAQEKIDSIYYHYETHNYAFSMNQPNFDVENQLKNIKVPVLISVGRVDWVTPVECSEVLHREIPDSTLIIYEKSGHSPHMEENEEYLQNMKRFIEEKVKGAYL